MTGVICRGAFGLSLGDMVTGVFVTLDVAGAQDRARLLRSLGGHEDVHAARGWSLEAGTEQADDLIAAPHGRNAGRIEHGDGDVGLVARAEVRERHPAVHDAITTAR